jgi:hypothetical protein
MCLMIFNIAALVGHTFVFVLVLRIGSEQHCLICSDHIGPVSSKEEVTETNFRSVQPDGSFISTLC